MKCMKFFFYFPYNNLVKVLYKCIDAIEVDKNERRKKSMKIKNFTESMKMDKKKI